MWIDKLDGKHVNHQMHLNVLDMILSQKLLHVFSWEFFFKIELY